MAQIILVLKINDDNVNSDGVKYAVQEAFGSEVEVTDAIEYPFHGDFSANHLSMLEDAAAYLSPKGEYTDEQLVNIVEEAARYYNAEDYNDYLADTAERLYPKVGEPPNAV